MVHAPLLGQLLGHEVQDSGVTTRRHIIGMCIQHSLLFITVYGESFHYNIA